MWLHIEKKKKTKKPVNVYVTYSIFFHSIFPQNLQNTGNSIWVSISLIQVTKEGTELCQPQSEIPKGMVVIGPV